MMLLLAMLLAASCLPRRGHAAHGLDLRLPRGHEALPGPGGGLWAGHQVTLATQRPIEPDARRLGSGSRRPRATLDRCWRPSRGAWLEAGRHPHQLPGSCGFHSLMILMEARGG